jgi:putative phosphoribosyl transferase
MDGRWTGPPNRDDVSDDPVQVREFLIDLDDVDLPATLAVPADYGGLVIFAEGGRAGHHGPASLVLAEAFQRAGLATLAFDMLTHREAAQLADRRDEQLLPHRLLAVTRWASGEALPRPAPIGYFGLGAGVPTVLATAAQDPCFVSAIVARGGRPDIADPNLRRIAAPTLFIAGQDESPRALELVAGVALPWLLERFHVGPAGNPRTGSQPSPVASALLRFSS